MASENMGKRKSLSPERVDLLIKAGQASSNEPGDAELDAEFDEFLEEENLTNAQQRKDELEDETENEFQVTAGLLARRKLRNYLNTAIFEDIKIEFLECKGLLRSTFTIKGPTNILRHIEQDLLDYKNG